MPTKKFFDLSEDKKKAFINAAIMEFERQSFSDASIFNIAHNAGVSRTGIYYYFTNKQDIYEYLLTLNRDRFFESIKSAGRLNIFELFMEYFDFMANYKGGKRGKLIRQVYKNIKLLDVNTLDVSLQKLDVKKMCEIINLSNLKYANTEVIKTISLVGFGSISKALSEYFSGKVAYEEARSHCEKVLECLKNGFAK